ncbi:MAG: response regulator [Fimbriimonadaceae bacterium]|nr:response regulator [Chitinophagales bacterium]
MKKLKCIMLIDDNSHDNFFHERAIKKTDPENIIIPMNSGREALEYLTSKKDPHPDLILLDINMPGMNGWEFLQEYNGLDKELQSRAIIIMLTNSENPAEIERAKTWSFVSEYRTKPLTKEIMHHIIGKYFT